MSITKIEEGVVAAIAYTLMVDGKVVEEVDDEDPIEYLHGAENIVPGLEKALLGKSVGDNFKITLQPAEAYGEYDEDLTDEISVDEFEDLDDLTPGLEIEIVDDEGEWYDAVVKEIHDGHVLLDFNPPLAGKVLHYDVRIVSVREASEEEREQGFPDSLFDDMHDDDDDEE